MNVTGKHNVGGLVGENQRQGRIIAAYATGDASSAIANSYMDIGALLGVKHVGNTFADIYWEETACDDELVGVGSDDINQNGVIDDEPVRTFSGRVVEEEATAGVICRTAAELKAPTGYTGIYAGWNVDVDGDSTADDPWDFGADQDYPTLD